MPARKDCDKNSGENHREDEIEQLEPFGFVGQRSIAARTEPKPFRHGWFTQRASPEANISFFQMGTRSLS